MRSSPEAEVVFGYVIGQNKWHAKGWLNTQA